jgi:hypothetical protein
MQQHGGHQALPVAVHGPISTVFEQAPSRGLAQNLGAIWGAEWRQRALSELVPARQSSRFSRSEPIRTPGNRSSVNGKEKVYGSIP